MPNLASTKQKGGLLASVAPTTKFANPIPHGAVTDTETLRHVLHRVAFNKHRSQGFVLAMQLLLGTKKVTAVIASIHDCSSLKLSSI
jgi:hypothetical protein